MDTFDKVLITVLSLLVAFCAAAIAYDMGQRGVRAAAVERGLAEWKVNEQGTNVTFVWKK
jgi:hypothetical protein